MLRELTFVAIVLSAIGCDDQRVATPSLPPSTGTRDAGRGGGGGTDDPLTTRTEGVLRLGHLNVRRYFDTTCESGSCEADGFEEVMTTEQFEERTAELALGLARLEADVITLAEVESQASLDALQARLADEGLEYPVAYLGEIGVPGSVDVAVLSRGKLESVKTYREERPLAREDGTETMFTRELPEVHLRIGEHDVIVFAAHFRSKATDDPGRRLAEAKATREIMLAAAEANPAALVLLGGDLNDVPGSPPLEAMEADGALVRVAKDLPAASQATYTFGGQKQAIDHIFTTASGRTAYVPSSAKVVRDGTAGYAGSDHAALRADFNLR